MKVALAVWENRISPLLDTARTLLIAELDQGVVVSTRQEMLRGENVQDLLVLLEASGVETLVCGAVSRRFATWLSASGLKLLPFISGEVEEVLEALLQDRLSDPSFAMPGCGHGGGRGAGAGGRCGIGHGGGGGRGRMRQGVAGDASCFQGGPGAFHPRRFSRPEACPDCKDPEEKESRGV